MTNKNLSNLFLITFLKCAPTLTKEVKHYFAVEFPRHIAYFNGYCQFVDGENGKHRATSALLTLPQGKQLQFRITRDRKTCQVAKVDPGDTNVLSELIDATSKDLVFQIEGQEYKLILGSVQGDKVILTNHREFNHSELTPGFTIEIDKIKYHWIDLNLRQGINLGIIEKSAVDILYAHSPINENFQYVFGTQEAIEAFMAFMVSSHEALLPSLRLNGINTLEQLLQIKRRRQSMTAQALVALGGIMYRPEPLQMNEAQEAVDEMMKLVSTELRSVQVDDDMPLLDREANFYGTDVEMDLKAWNTLLELVKDCMEINGYTDPYSTLNRVYEDIIKVNKAFYYMEQIRTELNLFMHYIILNLLNQNKQLSLTASLSEQAKLMYSQMDHIKYQHALKSFSEVQSDKFRNDFFNFVTQRAHLDLNLDSLINALVNENSGTEFKRIFEFMQTVCHAPNKDGFTKWLKCNNVHKKHISPDLASPDKWNESNIEALRFNTQPIDPSKFKLFKSLFGVLKHLSTAYDEYFNTLVTIGSFNEKYPYRRLQRKTPEQVDAYIESRKGLISQRKKVDSAEDALAPVGKEKQYLKYLQSRAEIQQQKKPPFTCINEHILHELIILLQKSNIIPDQPLVFKTCKYSLQTIMLLCQEFTTQQQLVECLSSTTYKHGISLSELKQNIALLWGDYSPTIMQDHKGCDMIKIQDLAKFMKLPETTVSERFRAAEVMIDYGMDQFIKIFQPILDHLGWHKIKGMNLKNDPDTHIFFFLASGLTDLFQCDDIVSFAKRWGLHGVMTILRNIQKILLSDKSDFLFKRSKKLRMRLLCIWLMENIGEKGLNNKLGIHLLKQKYPLPLYRLSKLWMADYRDYSKEIPFLQALDGALAFGAGNAAYWLIKLGLQFPLMTEEIDSERCAVFLRPWCASPQHELQPVTFIELHGFLLTLSEKLSAKTRKQISIPLSLYTDNSDSTNIESLRSRVKKAQDRNEDEKENTILSIMLKILNRMQEKSFYIFLKNTLNLNTLISKGQYEELLQILSTDTHPYGSFAFTPAVIKALKETLELAAKQRKGAHSASLVDTLSSLSGMVVYADKEAIEILRESKDKRACELDVYSDKLYVALNRLDIPYNQLRSCWWLSWFSCDPTSFVRAGFMRTAVRSLGRQFAAYYARDFLPKESTRYEQKEIISEMKRLNSDIISLYIQSESVKDAYAFREVMTKMEICAKELLGALIKVNGIGGDIYSHFEQFSGLFASQITLTVGSCLFTNRFLGFEPVSSINYATNGQTFPLLSIVNESTVLVASTACETVKDLFLKNIPQRKAGGHLVSIVTLEKEQLPKDVKDAVSYSQECEKAESSKELPIVCLFDDLYRLALCVTKGSDQESAARTLKVNLPLENAKCSLNGLTTADIEMAEKIFNYIHHCINGEMTERNADKIREFCKVLKNRIIGNELSDLYEFVSSYANIIGTDYIDIQIFKNITLSGKKLLRQWLICLFPQSKIPSFNILSIKYSGQDVHVEYPPISKGGSNISIQDMFKELSLLLTPYSIDGSPAKFIESFLQMLCSASKTSIELFVQKLLFPEKNESSLESDFDLFYRKFPVRNMASALLDSFKKSIKSNFANDLIFDPNLIRRIVDIVSRLEMAGDKEKETLTIFIQLRDSYLGAIDAADFNNTLINQIFSKYSPKICVLLKKLFSQEPDIKKIMSGQFISPNSSQILQQIADEIYLLYKSSHPSDCPYQEIDKDYKNLIAENLPGLETVCQRVLCYSTQTMDYIKRVRTDSKEEDLRHSMSRILATKPMPTELSELEKGIKSLGNLEDAKDKLIDQLVSDLEGCSKDYEGHNKSLFQHVTTGRALSDEVINSVDLSTNGDFELESIDNIAIQILKMSDLFSELFSTDFNLTKFKELLTDISVPSSGMPESILKSDPNLIKKIICLFDFLKQEPNFKIVCDLIRGGLRYSSVNDIEKLNFDEFFLNVAAFYMCPEFLAMAKIYNTYLFLKQKIEAKYELIQLTDGQVIVEIVKECQNHLKKNTYRFLRVFSSLGKYNELCNLLHPNPWESRLLKEYFDIYTTKQQFITHSQMLQRLDKKSILAQLANLPETGEYDPYRRKNDLYNKESVESVVSKILKDDWSQIVTMDDSLSQECEALDSLTAASDKVLFLQKRIDTCLNILHTTARIDHCLQAMDILLESINLSNFRSNCKHLLEIILNLHILIKALRKSNDFHTILSAHLNFMLALHKQKRDGDLFRSEEFDTALRQRGSVTLINKNVEFYAKIVFKLFEKHRKDLNIDYPLLQIVDPQLVDDFKTKFIFSHFQEFVTMKIDEQSIGELIELCFPNAQRITQIDLIQIHTFVSSSVILPPANLKDIILSSAQSFILKKLTLATIRINEMTELNLPTELTINEMSDLPTQLKQAVEIINNELEVNGFTLTDVPADAVTKIVISYIKDKQDKYAELASNVRKIKLILCDRLYATLESWSTRDIAIYLHIPTSRNDFCKKIRIKLSSTQGEDGDNLKAKLSLLVICLKELGLWMEDGYELPKSSKPKSCLPTPKSIDPIPCTFYMQSTEAASPYLAKLACEQSDREIVKPYPETVVIESVNDLKKLYRLVYTDPKPVPEKFTKRTVEAEFCMPSAETAVRTMRFPTTKELQDGSYASRLPMHLEGEKVNTRFGVTSSSVSSNRDDKHFSYVSSEGKFVSFHCTSRKETKHEQNSLLKILYILLFLTAIFVTFFIIIGFFALPLLAGASSREVHNNKACTCQPGAAW